MAGTGLCVGGWGLTEEGPGRADARVVCGWGLTDGSLGPTGDLVVTTCVPEMVEDRVLTPEGGTRTVCVGDAESVDDSIVPAEVFPPPPTAKQTSVEVTQKYFKLQKILNWRCICSVNMRNSRNASKVQRS